MVTVPAPYSPFGMVPSNEPYSIGWSSVCTARWFTPGSVGSPFGNAHDTSTPSRSRRKSWCRRVAWCSWMTNIGSPARAASGPPIGSGVFAESRIARYVPSRSSTSLPRWVARREFGERVSLLPETFEHLGELELPEPGGEQLAPGAGCGDRRTESPAQRIGHDRGLAAVVLAPVEQHLAAADGLLHVA